MINPATLRLAAYALACALLFGAGWIAQGWRLNAQIAQIEADQAQALTAAIQQARAEEQRRQVALEGIRKDAQDQITVAAADAAAAHAAADGMQQQLDRIKRKPACSSSAAAGGVTGRDSTTVLADLLTEVERAGRAMAEEAERRGIAGRACVKAYRSVE